MISTTHALLIVFTVALVTVALRFMPFVIFRQHTPRIILYLGSVLPYAIMGMLVVYCLKNVSLLTGSHGLPEAISITLVIVCHKIKHSTLLSILVGTLSYMALIQFIFI